MAALLTFVTKSRSPPGLQISAPATNPTLTVYGRDLTPIASEFRRTSIPPPPRTAVSPSGHSRNLSAPSSAGSDFSAGAPRSPLSSVPTSPASSSIAYSPSSPHFFYNRASPQDIVQPDVEFDFPRPSAEEIDVLFESVKATRNIDPLSREFTQDEKWLLALSDARMRWLDDKKPAKSNAIGGALSATNGAMSSEDSPESYLKMFMNNTITHKQVATLCVSLRIRPLSWLRSFLFLEGIFILALKLERISVRERSNEDILVEHEILKCLRGLANSQDDSALIQHQQSISYIACSFSTSNIASRRLAADILRCCVHVSAGLSKVIAALDALSSVNNHNDTGTFKYWFKSFNAALLDLDRSNQLKNDTTTIEYTIMNFRLINAILERANLPDMRMQLRSQMVVAGIAELLEHARQLKSPIVNRLVYVYEREAKKDHQQLIQRVNQDILHDMKDPQEIYRAIISTVEGSPAHAHFLSTMQHLLLIRAEGDQRTRYYELIDTLVTSVVLNKEIDHKGTVSDQAGILVERLVAQLDEWEQTRQAVTEAATKQLRADLEHVKGERDALGKDVITDEDGILRQLKTQLTGAEDQLRASRRMGELLNTRLEEQRQQYEERVQQLEAQILEMFSMLRAAGGSDKQTSTPGMGRAELVSAVQKQMERRRALAALERTRTKRGLRRSAKARPARIPEEEIEADEEGEENKSEMSIGRGGNLRSRAMKPRAPLQSPTGVAEEGRIQPRTEGSMQGAGTPSTETNMSDTRSRLHRPQLIRRDAMDVTPAKPVTKSSRFVVVPAEGAAPSPRKVTPSPPPLPGDSAAPRSPIGDGVAVTSGVSSDTTLSDLVDDSSDSGDDTNTLNEDYSAAVPDQDDDIEWLNYDDDRQRHFSTLTFESDSGTVYDDGDPTHVASKNAYYGGDDTVSIRSFNSILL